MMESDTPVTTVITKLLEKEVLRNIKNTNMKVPDTPVTNVITKLLQNTNMKVSDTPVTNVITVWLDHMPFIGSCALTMASSHF